MSCLRQRHFAALFGLTRKDFLQGIAESAAGVIGHEHAEAPLQEPGALDAEQPGRSRVRLADHPLTVEGQVTRWGELEKVNVLGHERAQLGARLPEFLVLHLQLDLVHPEFMDQMLHILFGKIIKPFGLFDESLTRLFPESGQAIYFVFHILFSFFCLVRACRDGLRLLNSRSFFANGSALSLRFIFV
jgi:hypothetical protein